MRVEGKVKPSQVGVQVSPEDLAEGPPPPPPPCQIRRAEVTEEWRRERRQRRRPDMPHYVPPNSRCSHYLLEVEVAPGRWHRVEVRRVSS